MRKFYSLALLFVASVFCSMAYGYTGKEDITSSKLTNPDFSAMTPVARTVRTYAKDLDDNGAGSDGTDLYGMQPVEGWTASNPTDNIKRTTNNDPRDAKAGGIFPIYDPAEIDEMTPEDLKTLIGLGGSFFCKGDKTQKALGITSVWSGNGATPIYSQDVTLPAGCYIIIFKIYNAAGTAAIKTNEFGFAVGETKFVSDKTSYPVDTWVEDTVLVDLHAETSGKVTLGFVDGGVGSASTEHLFIENVKILTIVDEETIAIVRADLLELINIGKSYSVETSASEAVYNNPNATLQQLWDAIKAQTEINESGITDLSSYFIVNSHFDEDDPVVGGICTYAKDCGNADNPNVPKGNYSMLPVVGWDRSTTTDGPAAGVFAIGSGTTLGGPTYVVPTIMSDGSSEGKVLGFVTSWSNIVQYKQAVTLLAGSYTLSMSYYNVAGTAAIVKNLIGFVSDEGTEYLSTRTTFPVGQWTKDEIQFTLDEETTGYFTLGYKAANDYSYNMPHFFTDGIYLKYIGTGIDPSMLALSAAVSGAKKILDKGEPIYTEIEKKLADAIDAGQKLIDNQSTDIEANKAAYEVLSGLVGEANASIAAYKKLDSFYNEGGEFFAAREKYTAEAGYKNTASALDPLGDEIEETGLSDYNLSTDRINEIISTLPTVIKTGVQADWDALVESGDKIAGDGIDISILFTGIGENGNYEGWTTNNGGFKYGYNLIEIFEGAPFTASKVFEKLPKGKYTVATKGFYRIGDNETNIDAYEAGGTTGAYVFAGASKSDMENVASVTFETADAYTGLAAAGSVFVINNLEGASKIFNDPDYADNYNASAATVLTKESNLTFGVTADQLQDANWVTWYQFSIYYNGSDVSDLQAELIAATETLNSDAEALNEYAIDYVEDITSPVAGVMGTVYNAALGVVDDAEGLYDEQDEETLINAIDKVKGQLDLVAEIQKSANENVEAVTKCRDARTALDDFMNNEMSEYTPSQEAINAATTLLNEDASDDAISALTTEEVNALTAKLIEAEEYLKANPLPEGYETASDEHPFKEMTKVIVNPSFEGDDEPATGSTKGWSWNTKATGDTGVKSASTSPYTVSNADGNFLFNTWNGSAVEGGFYVSQKLFNMPVGTYELQALLASDNGNVIALSANDTYGAVFTIDEDATVMLDASIIFVVEEQGEVEIKASSSTWFKADHFRLTYFGADSQKEPTDVEGVEAAAEAEIVAIYTASGTPVAQLQKGLNIVKYANGTIKKLFVK